MRVSPDVAAIFESLCGLILTGLIGAPVRARAPLQLYCSIVRAKAPLHCSIVQ